MANPKLNIEKEGIDHFYNGLSWIGLIAMIALPLYYYNQLPEKVPIHFNPKGDVDGWGASSTIWIISGVGVLLFLFLNFIEKIPHQFNYPVKITAENAQAQYRIGLQLMRFMKAMVMLCFAYISYSIIRSALSDDPGLSSWFLPVFLLVFFGGMGYYLRLAYQEK